MSVQVQLRRGTTAEHAAFTGALAEVTVDTTKKTVVVHDGTTAGGTPLAKESALSNYVQTSTLSNYVQTSAIGSTVQSYDADTAKTDVAQTFTAAQRGTISALSDGATITPDFAVANNFSVTLAGNRTLANPTNLTAGQSGVIYIVQDGSGGRTLSFGSNWDFESGTAPTLSTAANAVDALVYSVRSTSSITARLLKNFS